MTDYDDMNDNNKYSISLCFCDSDSEWSLLFLIFLIFICLVSLNQELPKPLSEEIGKKMDVSETVESSTLACVDDAEVGYTGLVRAQHHKATAF